MNFEYSQEAEGFRDSFRRWLEANFPKEWNQEVTGEKWVQRRKEWGKMLGQGGWVAPAWPKEYGGLGLTIEQQLVYIEELVRINAPEVLNSNGIGIFGMTLIRYGTEDQKKYYLPRMLNHEDIWCQGFSEPNAGSDLAGLQTKAKDNGDHYVLNGQKVWTSYGPYANKCYILVRTAESRYKGVSMMILDLDQPGVTVQPIKNIAGESELAEVFLDDAIVPKRDLVGDINDGWEMANYALAHERGIHFAQRSLKMQQEFQQLITLFQEQIQAGSSPANSPIMQSKLVQSYLSCEILKSVCLRNIALIAQGDDTGALPAIAKLVWSESHQDLLNVGVELLGEESLLKGENQVWMEKFLLSRAETIYAGTTQIQKNIIAKSLGLPSSKGGK
ncbi:MULTISPECIES: acyl-CoA dehydrogenase family protein [Bacillaceae]|jgi:alkylation response protein AidB-like acyl-CoA dehydrogenase|uniref:acyl-CoA dehydrogenase family protein n=1 Tax=Bacillaceae TaxID=186817 RepID=UPI001A8E1C1F|nr:MULTISPECIES: acyl-CoA dehydrogenase family protein [Bacillaceae]MBN8199878.1 acyl-CoA dehydrogenase family protein [Bacillus sp. NTK034]MCS0671270.1 acyl-CoA dehydrogenase family protein [Cytobacillus firmus]